MSVASQPEVLLDGEQTDAALKDLAQQILDREPETADLILIGIRKRGVELAERLADLIQATGGKEIPTGSLDITLYRDDFAQIGPVPVIGSTEVPADITDRHIVIVDDVLHTGRTVRAALNELSDFGRALRRGRRRGDRGERSRDGRRARRSARARRRHEMTVE
jgi:pyrimidine operon attenuation protein/uracil phosphoribosyltransferase